MSAAPRLWLTTSQARQEAQALVLLAECRLRRGEVSEVEELVEEFRALEDEFGAATLFGGSSDLADRFDCVVAAWRESL
jgi:hypothetical protein